MTDLYFTFLDGTLGYDCARCGSRCCHGLGFGLGRSELIPLLARRPALAPFVQMAGATATVFDLTDEGCFFLGGDGRCRIEIDDGRAAKPSVCRLFPFNRLHRIGAVTVVEPHLLLCPIEDRVGSGQSHRALGEELALAGDELSYLATTPPPGLPDGWVEREREVGELAASHLDAPDPIVLAAAQSPSGAERLASLRAWWHRSLGLDAGALECEARVARGLALLTPMLRFTSLFSVAAGPYPKVAARLPALLLGTALYGGLAARGLGRAPGLRSLGELFRATVFPRELLARWDRPVALPSSARESGLPPPVGAAYLRLTALLDGEPRTLGAAFDEATSDLSPHLRPLVLRALADRYGAMRFG